MSASGLLCGSGRSRPWRHRNEPGRNQRLFILFTVPAFPPVVLMLGYPVAFQIVLLADVPLLAFPTDCGYLFSCHHVCFDFFAKVARLSLGYNMHFIGCLPITFEYIISSRACLLLLDRLFLAHIVSSYAMIKNDYNLNIFCKILLFEIRILAVPFIPSNRIMVLLD